MEIAVATARKATHEANTVRSRVPFQLQRSADNFIRFLEDYYEYLNTDGLPSQEINSIISEHDIDRTSKQYIDLIQKEIAQNIPEAVSFDRVTLYKNIVKYYLTKGSEDSIINFFKIFYDEVISVTYPRDFLFKTSSGSWDDTNKKYRDTKGFSSSEDRLQDSYFWQDFSYVVNTSIEVSRWKDEFVNLVHPAGFKFFAVIVLCAVRKDNWIGRFIKWNPDTRKYEPNWPVGYRSPYKMYNRENLDWMKSLVPPSLSPEKYSNNEGYFMPIYQFGTLSPLVLANIVSLANADDETFKRIVYLTLCLLLKDECYDPFVVRRNDYIKNLKFKDSDGIREYKNTTINFALMFDMCADVELDGLSEIERAPDRQDILTIEKERILYQKSRGMALFYNRRLFSNISSFIDIETL